METFKASVQYGDMKGSSAADEADLEHAALELLRRIELFPFGALFLSHLSKSPI
ncbi:hypothetical protein [Vibrio cholerae]|uniref:hypothetical protein n=1 Tax=Vibrio cholerae TaxID=666 RepID=UPI001377C480|nr:hypothetical protein [Vibrio cholerae]GHX68074.1 hypothetical protein VCSRO65_3374 [Vibrio cholerae]